MKRNRLFIILGLVAIATSFSAFEILEPNGAPAGMSGSLGDMGMNCTSCHGGTATVVMNWISSNIPASGYVPGTTYQITATNSLTGSGKYGFEVTAENATGTKVGTLAAGSNNHLVGNGKYVTHNQANTTTNSWTFNWTAPASGTGVVIFYGAFAKDKPGPVSLSQMIVMESSVGMEENNASPEMTIGPNPSQGDFLIGNMSDHVEEIRILDVQGKEVYRNAQPTADGSVLQVSLGEVPRGMYFIHALSKGQIQTRKLMVN